MEVVKKERSRLAYYPELIISCKSEGALYASCVLQQENIKLNSCSKEFQNFKNCLIKAAVQKKTKL